MATQPTIRTLADWLESLPEEVDALKLTAGTRGALEKVAELGFNREDGVGWGDPIAHEIELQFSEAVGEVPTVRVQAMIGPKIVKTWTRSEEAPGATGKANGDPSLQLIHGHVRILGIYGDTIERLTAGLASAVEERDRARSAELEAHGELARLAAGLEGEKDDRLKDQAADMLGELLERMKGKRAITPEKMAEALRKNPEAARKWAKNKDFMDALAEAMGTGT
jgi:hypothetical protein